MLIPPDNVDKLVEKGQVLESQRTGLTLDGKEIVLQKTRGRTLKTSKHKAGWWPEEKKIEAATIHAATGSVVRAAALSKVPEATIRKWKEEDWWLQVQQRIRREENEETDRKFSRVVEKALGKIEERIDSGDYIYDIKRGIAVQVPTSARDLAIVAGTLFDKRQLLRGEATKINKSVDTTDYLQNLATKFAEAVTQKLENKKPPIDAESVEFEEIEVHQNDLDVPKNNDDEKA